MFSLHAACLEFQVTLPSLALLPSPCEEPGSLTSVAVLWVTCWHKGCWPHHILEKSLGLSVLKMLCHLFLCVLAFREKLKLTTQKIFSKFFLNCLKQNLNYKWSTLVRWGLSFFKDSVTTLTTIIPATELQQNFWWIGKKEKTGVQKRRDIFLHVSWPLFSHMSIYVLLHPEKPLFEGLLCNLCVMRNKNTGPVPY